MTRWSLACLQGRHMQRDRLVLDKPGPVGQAPSIIHHRPGVQHALCSCLAYVVLCDCPRPASCSAASGLPAEPRRLAQASMGELELSVTEKAGLSPPAHRKLLQGGGGKKSGPSGGSKPSISITKSSIASGAGAR